ncbi:MAG: hypothetical protein SFW67_00365 [Myxococcaceae bacterium]|nr:hypothetical protein [Myxococcaceae bacterium]
MTVAICMKCGGSKVGALSPCAACGFRPRTPDEGARSIWLSDQVQPAQVLAALSGELAAGRDIAWDEAAVSSWRGTLERTGLELPLGCHVLVWIPVVVLLGLIGVMLYLAA